LESTLGIDPDRVEEKVGRTGISDQEKLWAKRKNLGVWDLAGDPIFRKISVIMCEINIFQGPSLMNIQILLRSASTSAKENT